MLNIHQSILIIVKTLPWNLLLDVIKDWMWAQADFCSHHCFYDSVSYFFSCRVVWWTTLSGGCWRLRTMWSRLRTTSQNAKSSKRLANGWDARCNWLIISLFLSPLSFSSLCFLFSLLLIHPLFLPLPLTSSPSVSTSCSSSCPHTWFPLPVCLLCN